MNYSTNSLPPAVVAAAVTVRDAFFDVDLAGTPVRVYVASAGEGAALQVGRSLIEVEQALRQLVLTLAVISVVTVGLAAVIGRLVAGSAGWWPTRHTSCARRWPRCAPTWRCSLAPRSWPPRTGRR